MNLLYLNSTLKYSFCNANQNGDYQTVQCLPGEKFIFIRSVIFSIQICQLFKFSSIK